MGDNRGVMYYISKFIIDARQVITVLFIAASVFCFFSISKVQVNNDISSYLPSSTETRRGLDMMEEFTTFGTVQIMVTNITPEKAEDIKTQIEEIDHIKTVDFENTDEYYKSSSALFKVTADTDDYDTVSEMIADIESELGDYDTYTYRADADLSGELKSEMSVILLCALAVIVAVLLFTSDSYMEVLIFLIVFGAAAVLNKGTNYWFGEISFITDSIAVVLQLALGIDYAIILSNRFTEEKRTNEPKEAITIALSKAITEISSSSLTTIAGLIALVFMTLGIGKDMGVVLSKGILFSLLTVFLLMPALLLKFSNLIEKTRHRSYVPDISAWGRLTVRFRRVIPAVFALAAFVCVYLSSQCPYCFDVSSVSASKETESTIAEEKIRSLFGIDNQLAVILPKGDYASEEKLLSEVENFEHITSSLGLANVKPDEELEYTLASSLTPRDLAEFVDIDIDTADLIFVAYGMINEDYRVLFSDISDYRVPIISLVEFAHDEVNKGIGGLDEETVDNLNDAYDAVEFAKCQLEGETLSRIVFTYDTPIESDESYALLEEVRGAAEKYYDEPVLVSNSTSSYDLYSTFGADNRMISITTILFVLVILMFTFRSFGIPVLLIFTIQGSIWINFSLPTLTDTPLYFLSYLVVSSIQMGATIDYAIVITGRYNDLRSSCTPTEAAVEAVNRSFPTILTSGTILTVAGFLIGRLTSNAIIASVGTALGRGALISIILVMTVLPSLLILCDRIIAKTKFPEREKPSAHRTAPRHIRITVSIGETETHDFPRLETHESGEEMK